MTEPTSTDKPRCTTEAPKDIRDAARGTLVEYGIAERVDLDWQCCRAAPHGRDHHLAMPAGPGGPGIRFDPPPWLPYADLAELLARPGTTAVQVEHGDELLLLLPDADTATTEAAAQTLVDAFPTVSFLLLSGITGAVVMPRRGCSPACSEAHTYDNHCRAQLGPVTLAPVDVDQADEYHAAGVYCGEAAHCTPPYPEALPGTLYPQSNAQRLVDELLADADVDPRLTRLLADAGRSWGPTGVARAAARLAGTTLARDADAQPGPAEPQPDVDQAAEPEVPAYVHALVDAWLTGAPIDFGGNPVPAAVQRRLEHATARPQVVICRSCVFGGCTAHPGDTLGYPPGYVPAH